MKRPTPPLSKPLKGKFSLRILAFGILVLAGILLGLGYALQQPESPITKTFDRIGRRLGFPIADTRSSTADSSPPGQEATLSAVSVDEILRILNVWRKEQGLPEIVKNDRFCEFANARAKEVSQNWSQQTITENKDYYFRAVCLKCKNMAEVLAREVTNPQELVNRWVANDQTKTTLSKPYNIGCVGGFSPDKVQAYIALEMGERVE